MGHSAKRGARASSRHRASTTHPRRREEQRHAVRLQISTHQHAMARTRSFRLSSLLSMNSICLAFVCLACLLVASSMLGGAQAAETEGHANRKLLQGFEMDPMLRSIFDFGVNMGGSAASNTVISEAS